MQKQITPRERGAILAGLRLLQSHASLPLAIEEIATSAGDFSSLSEEEIDTLCERINLETCQIGGQ